MKTRFVVAGIVSVVVLVAIVVVVVVVVNRNKDAEEEDYPFIASPYNGTVCKTDLCNKTAEVFLSSINFKAGPCRNFYDFACGKFMETTQLKDNELVRGPFNDAELILRKELEELLQKFDGTGKENTAVGKAANLYNGCMNAAENEPKKNMKLLRDLFSELIAGWPLAHTSETPDSQHWSVSIAKITRFLDQRFFLQVRILPSDLDSSKPIIAVYPAPPGAGFFDVIKPLPTLPLATQYQDHFWILRQIVCEIEPKCNDNINLNNQIRTLQWMLSLLYPSGYSMAQNMSMSGEYSSMPSEILNAQTISRTTYTIPELQNAFRNVNWRDFFTTTFANTEYVLSDATQVWTYPTFLADYIKLFSQFSDEQNRILLGWMIVEFWSPILSPRIRTLLEQVSRQQGSTSDACLELVNNALGFAVGNLYSANKVPETTLSQADTIVTNLKDAFKELLQEEHWMDDFTKKTALIKLDKMAQSVGSPDWAKSTTGLDQYYSKMQAISKTDFQAGFRSARKFVFEKQAFFLNVPWDKRNHWPVETSAQVNAFYYPAVNAMMYPVGILTYPFFISGRTSAINYGSFGYVAGHEVTHGFDDQGSTRDENGESRDWWSSDAKKQFDDRKQCFINQYSKIKEPLTGNQINGILTLGENIADNGGIREAYRAFQKFKASQTAEEERPNGLTMFTQDQMFFLSAAHTYCTKSSPRFMGWQLLKDEHSPNIYRVSEPLKNSDDFSKAFNCPLGSPMNPKEKCRIW